jgi:hypothetical protein
MFTPGIYMQAQKVGFERDKLASFLLMMLWVMKYHLNS